MGEPADNVEHVAGALHAMVHPFGFRLGKSYVCVSTVGPSPAHIRALTPLPARLAWSVHAAEDRLRKVLVPTTRHSMTALRDAWGETLEARGDRGLMAEVTLIDGVNDGPEHAEQLHELLAPLPGKTRVNLIPYNANAGLGAAGRLFAPARPEAVRAFQRRLIDRDLLCTVRTPRGNEESSACGMLRVEKVRGSRGAPNET
jgi:23S rRNA (adenine2503-C2)-methyltransferase